MTANQGQRNLTGWLILAFMLTVMFVGELSGSISKSSQAKMDELDGELKTAVLLEQTAHDSPSSTATIDPKDTLHKLELELAARKDLDDQGRELYAAVLAEEKKPVPSTLYQPLLHSKSEVARTFGEIYGPPTLTPKWARQLQGRLEDSKEFAAKLAGIQALEKAGDRTARAAAFAKSAELGGKLVALGVTALMVASVFVWCGYIAARANGDLPPLGLRAGPLTLAQADFFAIRAAQVFAGWVLIDLIVALAFGKSEAFRSAQMFVEGIAVLLLVPLLFRLGHDFGLPSLADLGVTTQNLARNVLWGLAGFAAEIPITIAILLLMTKLFQFLPTPQHPAERELQQTSDPLAIAAILFLGTIVAAFWEEIVFRGLLFPALGRLCKSLPLGALISSMAFASIHAQGPAVWPSLCVVGLMSCALSYQTRSLVPSMVMHFCHNAVLFVIAIQQSAG